MTTGGEGGMVTTNDRALWESMWAYKDHGKSWNSVYVKQHPPGFRWLHDSFGSNYRMTEIQAVIGNIQLTRMSAWTAQRQANAQRIWDAAKAFNSVVIPVIDTEIDHACYKCYIFLKPEALKADWNRDKIIAQLNDKGVPCYVGSCSEVYLEQAFEGTPWRPNPRLANARHLGDVSLMFLVHPTLTDREIQTTTDTLTAVLQEASL